MFLRNTLLQFFIVKFIYDLLYLIKSNFPLLALCQPHFLAGFVIIETHKRTLDTLVCHLIIHQVNWGHRIAIFKKINISSRQKLLISAWLSRPCFRSFSFHSLCTLATLYTDDIKQIFKPLNTFVSQIYSN